VFRPAAVGASPAPARVDFRGRLETAAAHAPEKIAGLISKGRRGAGRLRLWLGHPYITGLSRL
jgi:hypothetical protein